MPPVVTTGRTLLLLLAALSGVACTDPCEALAERICQCQEDPNARAACRTERITNQKSSKVITDEDKSRCTAALDTCECVDLDENRTDECGYALEGPPPVADDAE
jgi:hypothetical protein